MLKSRPTSQQHKAAPAPHRGGNKISALTKNQHRKNDQTRLYQQYRSKPDMGYSGLVPSEHSTGGPGKAKRGGITKAGNCHLRRVMVEAAWAYRHRPSVQGNLKKRQELLSEKITSTAWKAQHRLHDRYRRLVVHGKLKPVVITAIARELLGFVWAVGCQVEQETSTAAPASGARAA